MWPIEGIVSPQSRGVSIVWVDGLLSDCSPEAHTPPLPNSGAIFAEQRKVHAGVDDCSDFSIVSTDFLNNKAHVSGGVMQWNFNNDQTFSPCKYCELDCTFTVRCARAWTSARVTRSSHSHTLVDVCVRLQGNEALLYRDTTSAPLVDSIQISEYHWQVNESTSP